MSNPQTTMSTRREFFVRLAAASGAAAAGASWLDPVGDVDAASDDQYIVAVRSEDDVAVYDVMALRTMWQQQLEVASEAAVVPTNSVVYAGETDGRLHAVSVRTGGEQWSVDAFEGERAIKVVAVSAEGVVVASDGAGELVGIDAETGEHQWTQSTDVSITGRGAAVAMPPEPMDDDEGGDGDGDGDDDGEMAEQPPAEGGRDQVMLAGEQTQLVAIDAQDGTVAWEFQGSGGAITKPVVAERAGVVCIAGENNRVSGVDMRTGERQWYYGAGGTIAPRLMIDRQEIVYYGDSRGDVHHIDADDGTRVYRPYELGEQLALGSAEGRALVFAGGNAGVVSEFQRVTSVQAGQQAPPSDAQWTARINASLSGGPYITADQVRVIDEEGAVHTIDRTTGEIVDRRVSGLSAATILPGSYTGEETSGELSSSSESSSDSVDEEAAESTPSTDPEGTPTTPSGDATESEEEDSPTVLGSRVLGRIVSGLQEVLTGA